MRKRKSRRGSSHLYQREATVRLQRIRELLYVRDQWIKKIFTVLGYLALQVTVLLQSNECKPMAASKDKR